MLLFCGNLAVNNNDSLSFIFAIWLDRNRNKILKMSDEEMDDDFSELQQAHQYQQKPTVIELQEDLSDDDLDSDDELGGEVDLDDDDLDDDDDDIEEQHLQTYKTLLETVLAQKYDYNSYIQLVETAQ